MYELTERRDVIEVPVYHKQQVDIVDLGGHGQVEFRDWEAVVQVGAVEYEIEV